MSRTKGAYSIRDEAERLRLYNQGLIDKEIANLLNYAVITIAKWRMNRGLPANGGTGWGGNRKGRRGGTFGAARNTTT